jgi:regulatory protein
MDAALRLISRRARSESEIRSALADAGASATVVRTVVSRLRALGYLDDRKLAADSVERWKTRGFGRLRIEHELRRVAVDEKTIEATALDWREERDVARRVLDARFGGRALDEPRERARAARFLAGRGFSAEVIDTLLDLCE